MALLVLGVGVVSSYSNEIELILKPGEKVEFINKEIEFLGIQDVQGPNYISKTAEIQASDDKSLLNIKTEKRF